MFAYMGKKKKLLLVLLMVFSICQWVSLLAKKDNRAQIWPKDGTHVTSSVVDVIKPIDANIPPFMEKLAQSEAFKTRSNPDKKVVRLPSPPCDAPTPIAQSDLPFTTPAPGKYCVVEDLTFSGGVAITVTEDNVCIDFDCHSLTLDPINTQGIVAANVSDLIVKNGVIQASAVSSDINSVGISLVALNGVTIDHMAFKNTVFGILADTGAPSGGSTNVTVTNCEFIHPAAGLGVGIQTSFVNCLVVKDCQFTQVGLIGIFGANGDRSVSISGCHIISDFSLVPADAGIAYQNIDGTMSDITISDCHVVNTNPVSGVNDPLGILFFNVNPDASTGNISIIRCDVNSFHVGIFAESIAGNNISNILIQDCTVLNNGFPPAPGRFSDSIELLNVKNVLIENCLAHSDPSSNAVNLIILGTFGGVSDPARNVIVRNCSFLNPAPSARNLNVLIGGLSGCLFENCIFDFNATSADLGLKPANLEFLSGSVFGLDPVTDAKVLNCLFLNNPTNHIVSEPGNSNIVIEGCTIKEGVEHSILFAGTSNSVIKGCSIVTSNGSGIVLTDGVFNETQFFSQDNFIFQNNIQDSAETGIVIKNNSSKNTIKENVVSNNGNDGIFIDHKSCKNTVIANNVFNNAHNGINNSNCKCNEFYDNSACNNKNENYVNVKPIVSVGEPIRTGGNLDCCKKKPKCGK